MAQAKEKSAVKINRLELEAILDQLPDGEPKF